MESRKSKTVATSLRVEGWLTLLLLAALAVGVVLLLAGRRTHAAGSAPGSNSRAVVESPDQEPSMIEGDTRYFKLAQARNHLDSIFSRERRDAGWTENMRQLLGSSGGPVLPKGSSTLSIDCRESICRIEIVHQALEHHRQFVQRAFRDPRTRLSNGANFSAVRQDATAGKIVTVSYIGREGALAFHQRPNQYAGGP